MQRVVGTAHACSNDSGAILGAASVSTCQPHIRTDFQALPAAGFAAVSPRTSCTKPPYTGSSLLSLGASRGRATIVYQSTSPASNPQHPRLLVDGLFPGRRRTSRASNIVDDDRVRCICDASFSFMPIIDAILHNIPFWGRDRVSCYH
jgi:hypothetical protein